MLRLFSSYPENYQPVPRSPPHAQWDTMGFLSTAHTPLVGIDPRCPSEIITMTGDVIMRQEHVAVTSRFTITMMLLLHVSIL